jgi:hypothetical protein
LSLKMYIRLGENGSVKSQVDCDICQKSGAIWLMNRLRKLVTDNPKILSTTIVRFNGEEIYLINIEFKNKQQSLYI